MLHAYRIAGISGLESARTSRFSLNHPSRAWRGLVAVAALFGAAGAAQAGEVQVTASIIIDYEFDTVDSQLTFVDTNNQLWVANVDPVTGNFVPSNGQGTLVDTGAAQASTFGNGPEWVQASDGFHIIYTKFTPGAPQTAANASIGLASKVNGKWQAGTLPNTTGMVEPIGNLSPLESNPPVVFRNGTVSGWQLYSQNITGQSAPVKIPNTIESEGSDRIVPNINNVVYTEPVTDSTGSTYHQVFDFDLGARTTTQLTTTPYNSGPVWMFKAPEYNNEYIFFTVLNEQRLVFYRANTPPKGGPTMWYPVAQMTNPTGAPPYIWSPEPFVYQGKTYVFFERSTDGDPADFSVPSQIWLASLDGTVNKQISDASTTNVVRTDPEFFITSSQGPQIYYNRYRPSNPSKGIPYLNLGVWRCDTGLGPPS